MLLLPGGGKKAVKRGSATVICTMGQTISRWGEIAIPHLQMMDIDSAQITNKYSVLNCLLRKMITNKDSVLKLPITEVPASSSAAYVAMGSITHRRATNFQVNTFAAQAVVRGSTPHRGARQVPVCSTSTTTVVRVSIPHLEAYHAEFPDSVLEVQHPICHLEALNTVVAVRRWVSFLNGS